MEKGSDDSNQQTPSQHQQQSHQVTFGGGFSLGESGDSNAPEGSDSGRSTPSKHHSDGTSGQASSSSSRPVAPLSLRRQIALALELSKDGKCCDCCCCLTKTFYFIVFEDLDSDRFISEMGEREQTGLR